MEVVEHSFQPDIGKASSLLPEELAYETSQERLERLAYRDKDYILSSRETIKEQYTDGLITGAELVDMVIDRLYSLKERLAQGK